MAATKYARLAEADRSADLIIRVDAGRGTTWEGSSEQLRQEGLIPDGFEWPRTRGMKTWTDGEWRCSVHRCRPPGLQGPMRLWSTGDYWTLSRSRQAVRGHPIWRRDSPAAPAPQRIPVVMVEDPSRLWTAELVGDVGLVRLSGVLTAGAACRVRDELQQLGLPVFAWVLDLTACMIVPGALAAPLTSSTQPAALVVATHRRHDVGIACQALALSGVLQMAFADEAAAMTWAQERALPRRMCAGLQP